MSPAAAARTPTPTRFDALTGLRAILAAWVALYHFSVLDADGPPGAWAGPLVTHGYLAVDGFFVLSGLVIAEGYARRLLLPGSFLPFLHARFARLYPVHLVTLVGMGAIVLGGAFVSGIPIRNEERFGSIALVQNLLLLHAGPWVRQLTWNYPSWSIAAEFGAYAAAPLAMRAIVPGQGRGRPVAILAFLLLALGLLGFGRGTLNLFLDGWALVRIGIEFPLGVALWAVLRRDGRLVLPGGGWLGFASMTLAATLGSLAAPDPLTVGALVLLLAALIDPADRLGRLLASAGMVRLGEASFALYMVHALVEAALIGSNRLGLPTALLPPAGLALLGLAVSQALGFVLLHAVERPGRAWILGQRSRDAAFAALQPGPGR